MVGDQGTRLEIESFNLTDLDVSALDARLELTTAIPNIIVCPGDCNDCGFLGCMCHGYS